MFYNLFISIVSFSHDREMYLFHIDVFFCGMYWITWIFKIFVKVCVILVAFENWQFFREKLW